MRYQILDITTINIDGYDRTELHHIMHITTVHAKQFEDIKSIACDKVTANRIKAALKQGIDCYLSGEFILPLITKDMWKDQFTSILGMCPRYIQDGEEQAFYEKGIERGYSRVFCIYDGPNGARNQVFIKGWSPTERQAYLFSITSI